MISLNNLLFESELCLESLELIEIEYMYFGSIPRNITFDLTSDEFTSDDIASIIKAKIISYGINLYNNVESWRTNAQIDTPSLYIKLC